MVAGIITVVRNPFEEVGIGSADGFVWSFYVKIFMVLIKVFAEFFSLFRSRL